MKNKKGLTLVELLAVVVILGIIAMVTLSVVSNVIQKQQEKTYYSQLNQLILSTENWTTDNPRKFYSDTCNDAINKNYQKLTLEQLQNEGYLSDKFVDTTSKDNSNFNNNDTFAYVYKFGKGYLYCIESPKCNKPKYKENKEKAANICCDGDNIRQMLQAENCSIPTPTQIILQQPIITVTPEGLVASKVATVNFKNEDSTQPINHYIYTTTNTISNKNAYKCEGTEKENLSCDNNPTTNIESGYWYKVIDNIVELTYTDTADVIAYNNLDSTWEEERAQITGFKPEIGLKITEKILTPEEYAATSEFDITYSNIEISDVKCIYGTDSNNLTSNGVITTISEDATSGKNDYKCEMNNLTPNTTYYYKIVANNDDSTAYTNSFKTLEDKQSPEATIIEKTVTCINASATYDEHGNNVAPTGQLYSVILSLKDEPYSKITASLVNTSGTTVVSSSKNLDASGNGQSTLAKACMSNNTGCSLSDFESFSIVVTDENGNSNRIDNVNMDNATYISCSSSSTTPSTTNINQPSGPRTSSCSSSSCSCGYTCTVVNQGKSLLVNKNDGSGVSAILDAKTGKTITAMNQGGIVSSNGATSVGKNYLGKN